MERVIIREREKGNNHCDSMVALNIYLMVMDTEKERKVDRKRNEGGREGK